MNSKRIMFDPDLFNGITPEKDWLLKNGIYNFDIVHNSNNVNEITINGDLDISKKKWTHLKYKIHRVKGNFIYNKYVTTDGVNFPLIVEGQTIEVGEFFKAVKSIFNSTL